MSRPGTLLRVALPVPVAEGLDYVWPEPGRPPPPGSRVRVPFKRGERVAIVIEHPEKSAVAAGKLRAAGLALDPEPLLGEELLETLRWAAEYYHHPAGEVFMQAIPGALRRGAPLRAPPARAWRLTPSGRQETGKLRRGAARQAAALAALADEASVTEAALRAREISADTLRRLAAKGWIEAAAPPAPPPVEVPDEPMPSLSAEQQAVLGAVRQRPRGFNAFLLHGVTGSGKTEVYLRLAGEEIAAGRQTLLLVPEIGLTPQLVRRLTRRFGERLAVMHSGLSEGARLAAWQHAFSGEASLVVGTRSAVFAPLPRAGLLIVDEEHDASYKQQEGFRYSARDLAVVRARRLGVPVLLASATPSLESFHNARSGRYQLLRMPSRIGTAGPPAVRIVDMNRHAARHGLSTPLVAAVEQHLSAGNQVILFLNRRGFAPALFCAACRRAEQCSRCDARMTVHAAGGRVRCHHCGQERVLKWACEQCGAERIAVGSGTERVTTELEASFPEARVARLDRDTTSRRGALDQLLEDVEQGRVQILVGTQMLAKGHDFPRVTLVGVLNADQGIFGTDFRSDERLAQTILQVSGRAGRGDRPGEVLIQTHFPEHPLLASLRSEDYASFADLALAARRDSGWPPFSHLAVLRAEATQREFVRRFLDEARDGALPIAGPVTVLGPAPAPMERRGGRYRGQLLFQCRHRQPLHKLLDRIVAAAPGNPSARRVRWTVDVDPLEL